MNGKQAGIAPACFGYGSLQALALEAAQVLADAIQFTDCISSLEFDELNTVAHLDPANAVVAHQKPHGMAIA